MTEDRQHSATSGRPVLLASALVYAVCVVWAPQRVFAAAFQMGIFTVALVTLVRLLWSGSTISVPIPSVIATAACVWGCIQVLIGSTVSATLTWDGALYWLTASAVILLSFIYTREDDSLLRFLKVLLYSGFGISLLGTVQSFTSNGRVLWLFPTLYTEHVIGPFVYHNNYAAFIELLIPIALWLALDRKQQPWLHLAMAGWMMASVFASGSRMGTLLVGTEVMLVFGFTWVRSKAIGENLRLFLPFAAALAVATVVCGHEFVVSRFGQAQPYAVRHSFLLSSVEMFNARPLTGFGFGTWPFAYKRFALIDTGSFANHAHSEWAQWAAEGGLPMLLLMVGLGIWCFRAAVTSWWGVGILAVLVHAIVDYPFVRLGLAVWVFGLMGAMDRRSLRLGWSCPRLAIAPVAAALILGVFVAGRDAYADLLFTKGTVASVTRAVQVSGGRTEYHRRLAALDPEHAVQHLRIALRLNPLDTRSRIELATEVEATGGVQEAEQLLREAARLDKQYAPAWALANHYLRTGATSAFWHWARRAAEMAPENLSGLFELCFHATEDPRVVYEHVVQDTRLVSRYIAFLVQQGRSESVADLIATIRGPLDREPLLSATDALLRSGDNARAHIIWTRLAGRQATITNGDFSANISGRGFDWRFHPHPGIETSQSGGVSITLTGEQPERWDILTQPLALPAGAEFTIRVRYRTTDMPPVTGLSCQVGSEEPIAFHASTDWTEVTQTGTADSGGFLALRYVRPLGTTRAAGRIELQEIRVSLKTRDGHV